MIMKRLVVNRFVLVILFSSIMISQQIEIKTAKHYFDKIKEICDQDDGKTWGVNLHGPFVIIDAKSLIGYANKQVPIGGWQLKNGIYTGKMHKKKGFSNTSFDWRGEKWSSIVTSSLQENRILNYSLLIHELMHQHEETIGNISEFGSAKHLNERDGRAYLFLEWNALLDASKKTGTKRLNAIKIALAYRKHRLNRYDNVKSSELGKELHEGMAEYTGMKLSGMSKTDQIKFLEKKIEKRYESNSVVWVYAYTSGPLYGFLLDEINPEWHDKLNKDSDLGQLLANEYKIAYQTFSLSKLEEFGSNYEYEFIMDKEDKRVASTLAKAKMYTKHYITGPYLYIPKSTGMNISFDPGKITPFKDYGTVYGKITVTFKWGILDVRHGGALLLGDWSAIKLYVGDDWSPEKGFSNERWKLTKTENQIVIKEKGHWVLKQKKN